MSDLRSLTAAALALKYRTDDALKDPRALLLPAHIRQIFRDQAELIAALANKIDQGEKWQKPS